MVCAAQQASVKMESSVDTTIDTTVGFICADHRQVEYVLQKMSVVQSVHDGLLASIASVQSEADQSTRFLPAAPDC
jgi:hypothetical protein